MSENLHPKIIAVAILDESGVIFSLPPPARHHDILHKEEWRSVNEYLQRGEQGFLLDNGKFIRRKPAALLAKKNGQLKKPLISPPIITSEDLW